MATRDIEKQVIDRVASDKDSPFHKDGKHAVDGGVPDIAVLESDLQTTSQDLDEALANSATLTEEDVIEAARDILRDHSGDPNFSHAVFNLSKLYVEAVDAGLRDTAPAEYEKLYQKMRAEAALVIFNSPYQEVRAVVDNHDDPSMPANTVRGWIIGLIFVAAGSFINQFFSIRYPSISVGSNVAQVLAYPAGKFLERVLPDWRFKVFGNEVSLNPGPFNQKEHMVITIMANVGFTAPYTNYVVFVQYIPRFFNMSWASDFGYQILVGLSTNFIGYGLAGLTRRFLVYPVNALWYSNLATIALNRAFHDDKNPVANGWKISRMRYFLYCFIGMFCYFWLPGYLCLAMSFFNWTIWIAPENATLSALTGITGLRGLGLNPWTTFDYNMLGVDPFVQPFFATMNYFIGMLIATPIVCALYFNNIWYSSYITINSNGVFDRFQKRYNVSKIIDDRGLFDQAAYEQYSPAYLSAGNMLGYGMFFAMYSATITHAIMYHRKEIWTSLKSIFGRGQGGLSSRKDVHSRLMSVYKEVPEWWYMTVLILSIALGAAGIGAYPTATTPAVVLYGVALAVLFAVPIGIIYSTTNIEITLNVIAEFFGGIWFEGNALAMNYFKSYGYVTTAHAITFAQDLKLAHYTHIPPRVTFFAQIGATLVSTFVTVGIMNYQMSMPDVCDPQNKLRFYCLGLNTFFTASVLWGTLGPIKMFGANAMYNGLIWCFLIGAALPLIFHYSKKRFTSLRDLHMPVIIAGMLGGTSGFAGMFQGVAANWLFNVYIKRRYLAWWSKYNYITSTAFAAGMAICAIVIYFALDGNLISVDWVGNNKPFVDNCDANGCTRFNVEPGEWFGPGVGEFH